MSIDLEAIEARAEAAIAWVNVQHRTDVSSNSLIQLGWDIKALIAEVKRQVAEIAAVTAERDAARYDFAEYVECGNNAPKIIADLIDSLTAQLTDYHHMEQLVDGKMAENQRLRKINEKLQSQLAASQRREQAAVELVSKIYHTADDGFCDSCREIVSMIDAAREQEAEKGEAE